MRLLRMLAVGVPTGSFAIDKLVCGWCAVVLLTACAASSSGPKAAAGHSAPSAASPRASDDIRIGYTGFLTGLRAALGAKELQAIQLAVKEVNTEGGINGKKVTLVVADNRSTPEGAKAAVRQLIEEDHVLAIVGPILSPQVLAVSEQIRAAGVPTMIGGSAVALTRQGNPWLFRVRPDDSIAALAMVKYAHEELKVHKIGILHDSDAFGVGGADLLERAAKERGLEIVGREQHVSGAKDFRAQLEALRAAGAQVLLTYNHEGDAGWIQRQYREMNLPYAYLGSAGSQVKSSLSISGHAAEGLLAVADFVPGQGDANKRYAAAYAQEYHEPYDATASWVYDGLQILAAAIRVAGEDRSRIREAILGLKNFEGVLGSFSFTPNGDGLHQVSVVKIVKGRPELLKVVSVEAQ